MTIDILFPTFNRLEFTRQALAALAANTNWSLVRRLVMVDDGSTDGTWNSMESFALRFPAVNISFWDRMPANRYGSPAAIMNAFVRESDPPDCFAKIDSDVIVPPGYLDRCASIMQAHPELDLLGIEPPASRTPHYEGMKLSATPELTGPWVGYPTVPTGYAPCDSIGGIGLMRTRCFLENEPLVPHSTYGGFTEWQLSHPRIRKGWCMPPLDVFLLDRMPTEPWASLSKEYEAKNWQRAWSKYPKDSALWKWWMQAEASLYAPGK